MKLTLDSFHFIHKLKSKPIILYSIMGKQTTETYYSVAFILGLRSI